MASTYEQFLDKAIADGFTDEEIASAWAERKAAKKSSPVADWLGKSTQSAKEVVASGLKNHPMNMALRAMGLDTADKELSDVSQGLIGSFMDLPMTAMSLIDEEGSKSAVDKLREADKNLVRGSGIGHGIGEVASFVVPGAAASKVPKIASALRSIPKASSLLGKTATAMGAGAGGSAFQGVLAPVGSGETRTDSLGTDAIIGGVTAGMIPAGGAVVNTIRSKLPEKAMYDLMDEVVGKAGRLDTTNLITKLGEEMAGKVASASKRADATFAGKGPIVLPAGRGSLLDSSKYPVIRDTIDGLQLRLNESADMTTDFGRSVDSGDVVAMRQALVDMQKGSKGVPPTAAQRAELDAAIADLDDAVRSSVDKKTASAYDKSIAARERSDLFIDPDSVTGKGVKAGFEGAWADEVLKESKRVDDAVRMLTPASQRANSPMEEALRVRLAAALRDNPNAARGNEVTERLFGADKADYIRDAAGKLLAPEDASSWVSVLRKVDPGNFVQKSFRGILPYGKRADALSRLAEDPIGLALLSGGVTGSME